MCCMCSISIITTTMYKYASAVRLVPCQFNVCNLEFHGRSRHGGVASGCIKDGFDGEAAEQVAARARHQLAHPEAAAGGSSHSWMSVLCRTQVLAGFQRPAGAPPSQE